MPIILKTSREIEMMRRAGQVAARHPRQDATGSRPWATTYSVDMVAKAEMDKVGAKALSKNYPTYKEGEGFPGHTCISVNEEVVHGIPGSRHLKEADVVTLDLAMSLDGYCADTALTVGLGKITPIARKLLDVTRQTLEMALEQMKPGKRWSDIARLMQHNVESNRFSVVREFVGHGIGRLMHEDPKVPNFVTFEQLRSDFVLREGMTLAVEPMVVAGRREVDLLPDQWTVVTSDGKPAAQFEHTVAITSRGVDVLTDGRPKVVAAPLSGGIG